jgi:hypothetical protein
MSSRFQRILEEALQLADDERAELGGAPARHRAEKREDDLVRFRYHDGETITLAEAAR